MYQKHDSFLRFQIRPDQFQIPILDAVSTRMILYRIQRFLIRHPFDRIHLIRLQRKIRGLYRLLIYIDEPDLPVMKRSPVKVRQYLSAVESTDVRQIFFLRFDAKLL